MQIFISYSKRNRDQVKALCEDLQALGHVVWFDRELTGGHVWWEQILDSVRRSDLFIFALSNNSLESQACRYEYQYAHQLQKRVLPVLMVDDVNTRFLPPELSAMQYVDYTRRDTGTALALSKALANLPAPRPLPDVMPAPPPVPVNPLNHLKDRIDNPEPLGQQEQADLFFQIKAVLNNDDTMKDGQTLLSALRRRSDILASIAQDIDKLLTESGAVKRPAFQTASGSISQPAFGVVAPGFTTPATGAASGYSQVSSDNLADAGTRFVAFVIDSILLFVIAFVIGFAYGFLFGAPDVNDYYYFEDYYSAVNNFTLTTQLLGIVVNAVYYMYFLSQRNGQTPGKMAMKIRVVKKNGAPVTAADAFLRNVLGYGISAVVLLLGFIWVLFDKERQGWHDKLANTLVVKTQ